MFRIECLGAELTGSVLGKLRPFGIRRPNYEESRFLSVTGTRFGVPVEGEIWGSSCADPGCYCPLLSMAVAGLGSHRIERQSTQFLHFC